MYWTQPAGEEGLILIMMLFEELLQQTLSNSAIFYKPVECANARIMNRDRILRHQNMRGYTGILNAAFDIIRSRRVEAILPVRYNLPVRCTFSVV